VKQIKDASAGSDGRIETVTFAGNTTPTPIATAIRMAERGEIAGVHVVTKQDRSKYLRTNPDDRTTNNLTDLAGRR
jgi:hypothetical protein